MAVDLFEPQGRWWLWRDGVKVGVLPEWVSYRVQVPRTSVGGFELVYPLDGLHCDALIEDVWSQVSYEVMGADGAWHEPANCRFVPLRRSVDYSTGTLTLTGASYGWLLGKAVRWFQSGDEDADGKKVFVNASAGTILQWHYYWAAVRRALQNVTIDFDGSTDSDGVAWADRFDVAYERGVTLRAIWDGFDTDGIVWRTYGDTVQVAQDRFADVPDDLVVLRAGVDCEIDRIEVSMEDAAGAVMMTGQNTRIGRAVLPAVGPWGRWEVSVSQSGTTTEETLTRLAQVELAGRGLVREGATVTLLPSATVRPFDTLFPGQPVSVRMAEHANVFRWGLSRWDGPDPWGTGEPWSRSMSGDVAEIVVVDDGTHATVSLTVGDRSESPTEILARTVRGVTGGRVARRSVTGAA